jgi:glycosyltransferase involved in cell wall biosynthesis
MNIIVAIPAFNEATVIGSVIDAVRQLLPMATIVVIDDGSSDGTSTVAADHHAVVIRHAMNRGLGGAIGTALLWARNHHTDALVTIDADGQHDPHDILAALGPIEQGAADLVIGSRMLGKRYAMPIDRRIINRVANVITHIMFGVSTTDSQSGFRVFGKKAIEHIHLKTNRMEVSSEIFAESFRLKLQVTEVPIQVIYTDYSRRKGQTNMNALAVMFRLFLRLFR